MNASCFIDFYHWLHFMRCNWMKWNNCLLSGTSAQQQEDKPPPFKSRRRWRRPMDLLGLTRLMRCWQVWKDCMAKGRRRAAAGTRYKEKGIMYDRVEWQDGMRNKPKKNVGSDSHHPILLPYVLKLHFCVYCFDWQDPGGTDRAPMCI